MLRRGAAFGQRKAQFQARKAVAAMEFALLAPVMAIITIGVFELAKATILWEQVWAASRSIAVSASTLALTNTPPIPTATGPQTYLTVAQVQQALSVIFAEIPWIRDQIEQGDRWATLSSIEFVPSPAGCTTNCTYAPTVHWSVQYMSHGFDQGEPTTDGHGHTWLSVLRPCNAPPQTQVSPTQPPTMLTLPTAGVSKPDSILVADVHYQYTPLFMRFLTGPVNLVASSYWSVRVAQPNTATLNNWTAYDPANQAAGAGKCL